MMKASIVIAVRGDKRVYRLLESLQHQSCCKTQFEVIVVENGTKDLSNIVDMANLRIKYINLAVANMAAARNAGLASARGTYILSTDADVVASPEWVERMVAGLENSEFGAVGGAIRKLNPTTLVQKHAITIVDGQNQLSYLPALHLPYVAGANCGYRANAIRAVGGFDDELKSGSDVDICYKLGLNGWPIGLTTGATVYHEDRAGIVSHFNRFRRYAIYQVCLFKKYKHISKRRYAVNAYPWQRLIGAVFMLPRALTSSAKGDVSVAVQATLQAVEAVGIWVGSIQGALRYRQLYV